MFFFDGLGMLFFCVRHVSLVTLFVSCHIALSIASMVSFYMTVIRCTKCSFSMQFLFKFSTFNLFSLYALLMELLQCSLQFRFCLFSYLIEVRFKFWIWFDLCPCTVSQYFGASVIF